MKNMARKEVVVKIYGTFGGIGLWMLSLTASALSLGQSQGQVILGAPLDLVFQLQTDAGTDVAASCVDAELLLGNRRIDSGRVRVTPASAKSVRVTSSVTVDEPVVVVSLSAGCSGRVVRQYTFFADPPETVSRNAMPFDIAQLQLAALPTAGAATPPAVRTASGASSAQPAAVAAPAAATAATAPSKPKPKPKPKQRPKPKPQLVPRPPQTLAKAPVEPAAAPAGGASVAPAAEVSRLRMEPLEHWSGNAATAAAGAGAALNQPALPGAVAAPAESAAQRVLALEAQMQALKEREASQSASLAQMRSEIAALQERGQGSAWTLPLLTALAIVLAVLAWLLLRLRSLAQAPQRAWIQSVDASLREADVEQRPAAGPAPAVQPASSRESVSRDPLVAPGIELFPALEGDEAGDGADWEAEWGAPALPTAQAGAPVPQARAMVQPEAFFDVRQQAEFYMSVGEYEQAIAVMREHIAQHPDSSPLAYLELLGLFYQLSRKNAFDALREQFAQHFTAQVPDMLQFAQRGRSLEDYGELLARIEALWSTDQVVELLESQLFRRDGVDQRFDLEAYDDLLLLLSVARATSDSGRGPRGDAQRRSTPAPWLEEGRVAAAATPAAATAASAAALAIGDAPWAALEQSSAPLPELPELPELPIFPDGGALSLETPSRFDVPEVSEVSEVPFARSQPLTDEPAVSEATQPLLDIDLSGGDSRPLAAQSSDEALAFDAAQFPQRAIIVSGVDQGLETAGSIDPEELMRTLSADMTLTPQAPEEADKVSPPESKSGRN